MKSKYIAEGLHRLEQTHERDRANLDTILSSLADQIVPAADHFIVEHVEEAIKASPDVVQKLGLDGLRKLKSEYNSLREQVPNLVRQELGSSDQWPHRRENPLETSTPRDRSRIHEDHPRATFRAVVSHVGSLLDRFGLLKEPPGHSPRWSREGGRIRYSIGLPISNDLANAIEVYQKALVALSKLNDDIRRTSKELEEAKAKELWDQA